MENHDPPTIHRCPHCEAVYRISPAHFGRRVRCAKCNHQFHILPPLPAQNCSAEIAPDISSPGAPTPGPLSRMYYFLECNNRTALILGVFVALTLSILALWGYASSQNPQLTEVQKCIAEKVGDPKSLEFIHIEPMPGKWLGLKGATTAQRFDAVYVKYRARNNFGAMQVFEAAVLFQNGKLWGSVPKGHGYLLSEDTYRESTKELFGPGGMLNPDTFE